MVEMLPLLCWFFLAIFLAGVGLWVSTLKYRKLPGRGPPIVGNLYNAITKIPTTMTGAIDYLQAGHNKYGDIVALHFGPFVNISIKDPFLIEELAHNPKMIHKDPKIYDALKAAIDGLVTKTETDKEWKECRKPVTSTLSTQHLELYHEIVCRRSRELIKKLATKEGEFDIRPSTFLMSSDIALESFAGIKYDLLKNEKIEIYDEFFSLLDEMSAKMTYGGLIKTQETILTKRKHLYSLNTKAVKEIMEGTKNRKSEPEYETMMDKMLAVKLRSDVPIENLHKSVAELFVEGSYPVAVLIADTALHMATNPEFQKKAWEEQYEIFGDSLVPPSFKDLNRMVYLDRIVNEALRLGSPPATGKRSSGNVKAGGTVIPKNSTVLFFWGGLRSDRRYWKSGDTFDPDNFLPEEVAKRPKGANLSFSLGPRSCPGYQFTKNCMKVVLSDIIRAFRITTPLKAEDLKYRPYIMCHLDVPHLISLKPRIPLEKFS